MDTALFGLVGIRKSKGNTRLLFSITLYDIFSIYLHKVAWACPTLRIGVGFATHILICYISLFVMQLAVCRRAFGLLLALFLKPTSNLHELGLLRPTIQHKKLYCVSVQVQPPQIQ